jgi:hypothetical protein
MAAFLSRRDSLAPSPLSSVALSLRREQPGSSWQRAGIATARATFAQADA